MIQCSSVCCWLHLQLVQKARLTLTILVGSVASWTQRQFLEANLSTSSRLHVTGWEWHSGLAENSKWTKGHDAGWSCHSCNASRRACCLHADPLNCPNKTHPSATTPVSAMLPLSCRSTLKPWQPVSFSFLRAMMSSLRDRSPRSHMVSLLPVFLFIHADSFGVSSWFFQRYLLIEMREISVSVFWWARQRGCPTVQYHTHTVLMELTGWDLKIWNWVVMIFKSVKWKAIKFESFSCRFGWNLLIFSSVMNW